MPATGTDYLDISEAYAEVREEIQELFKVGTNKPLVKEHLREATYHLDRGDNDRAIYHIEQAHSTARMATQDFINNLMIEVRNILLSSRTVGGDISTARPMLITAKKMLGAREYRRAASLCLESVETIKGLSHNYTKTLKELMKVKYNLTLLESLGLDMTTAQGPMEQAFTELKGKNYRKALAAAEDARAQVREININFKETSKLMTEFKFIIRDGRDHGMDVIQAQRKLDDAVRELEAKDFESAREILADAIRTFERENEEEEEMYGARMEDIGEMARAFAATVSSATRMGLDTAEAQRLIEEINQAMERGDLQQTEALLKRLVEEVERIHGAHEEEREEDMAQVIHRKRTTAKEAIDRGKRMGADVSDAEMHYAMGMQKERGADFQAAIRYYSKALDDAIRAGKAMAWKGER